MNETKINEWLKAQVEAETPDMLDELMDELPSAAAEPAAGHRHIRRLRSRRQIPLTAAALAAAACLALGLIGGGLFGAGRRPNTGQGSGKDRTTGIQAASVTLDVNPSVKMTIDADDRVIACEAVNDDGKKILRDLDLTGSDMVVASYAIVGGMLTNGYLTDAANSVLVTVTATDQKKGREVEQYLSREINAYLEKSSIGAAIIGQYIDEDDAVEAFAGENGISEGKAWIIRQLADADPRLSEESLLKLSTQELMVLWTSRKPSGKNAASDQAQEQEAVIYGSVSTQPYIAQKEAQKKALAYVGITEDQVSGMEIDFECEDGVIIYEVDFEAGGREYGIDVDAVSGEIIGGAPGRESTWEQQSAEDDDDGDDGDDDRYDDDADDGDDDRYDDDDDDNDDRGDDDGDREADDD